MLWRAIASNHYFSFEQQQIILNWRVLIFDAYAIVVIITLLAPMIVLRREKSTWYRLFMPRPYRSPNPILGISTRRARLESGRNPTISAFYKGSDERISLSVRQIEFINSYESITACVPLAQARVRGRGHERTKGIFIVLSQPLLWSRLRKPSTRFILCPFLRSRIDESSASKFTQSK